MDKIFMTCLHRSENAQEATLAVLLKGDKEHAEELKGFLKTDVPHFKRHKKPP